jgi:ABC-type transport system involved in multi-copper enzyme maturation permease subunit
MTFLPIAERELRVAARSARTYWSRALAALVLIVIALVIFDGYGRFGRSQVGGQQVFSALAYLALGYSVFAGAALTADCLSSEKREETLGFLFLTDLKGYDVVLGKLCATSLRSIYGLLATFPIMSLPLLLGGVRASEFERVILVVLNTLFLSLALGLLISTLFRSQRVTTNLAALIMLLLALVPIGVGFVLRSLGGAVTWYSDPSILSPLSALQAAFERNYRVAALTGVSFWSALLVQSTLAILLLARASWLLPSSWQETAVSARNARPAQPFFGGLSRRRSVAQRRRMLDQNPFYWLAGRGRGATAGMLFVLVLVGAWGMLARENQEDFAAVQGVGILLVALVTRLLIAVVAAQRFAEDKQNGALDLIITTPLTVQELVAGQWKATWRKLGWPVAFSLLLYLFLIYGAAVPGAGSEQEARVVLFTTACLFVGTVADVAALGWLGMWAGLRFRQVPHGAALCLGKVVGPPAIVAAALVWQHGFTSADEYLRASPYWLPSVWLAVALATDLFWTLWARQKLFADFRVAATERSPAGPGFFSRWWQFG